MSEQSSRHSVRRAHRHEPALTYRVLIESRIRTHRQARGTAAIYVICWIVGERRKRRSFHTRELAEGFQSRLLAASRNGIPFDMKTGLPLSSPPGESDNTGGI